MKLSDYLNEEWLDADRLAEMYANAKPYPHIKMANFIRSDLIEKVVSEFPDLRTADLALRVEYANQAEIKFASRGYGLLSKSAFELVAFLNSDVFLDHLRKITGIERPLLSDPTLAGAGYHEIKRGGLLKIHADFNKHTDEQMDIDRRLNLLIYLNKDWDETWGGDFQMFDKDMNGPVDRVYPHFNTCMVFSTTSESYHGHPDPVNCPEERSRRSLALYYYTTGRPDNEANDRHSTLFMRREGEEFREGAWLKTMVRDFVPPIAVKAVQAVRRIVIR